MKSQLFSIGCMDFNVFQHFFIEQPTVSAFSALFYDLVSLAASHPQVKGKC